MADFDSRRENSDSFLQEALAEETELSREAIRVPELSGQAQGEGQKERKPPEAGRNPLRHLTETCACVCVLQRGWALGEVSQIQS